MMPPQLSFIIPTHNRPDMLSEAVASVCRQTSDDWELIIVDDGSSHETASAIASFSDPRIKSCRHEAPRGVSAARNRGIREARSDYIAFLDDDDTLSCDYATHLLATFRRYDTRIDFAWPMLTEINTQSGDQSQAQTMPCLILSGQGSEDAFTAAAYIRTTGMAFRTKVFEELEGFDESLRVSEDRDLIFRLLNAGRGCALIEEPLVNFFIHGGPRLSTSDDRLEQACCDQVIAQRHAALIADHPGLASRFLNMLARRQRDAGQIEASRQTLKTLLKIRPTDFRARKRLIRSFFAKGS